MSRVEEQSGQSGDNIITNVGEGASHVIVGKNIIQVGSISIPRYLLILIGLTTLIVAGVALWFIYWFLPPTTMPTGTFNVAVAKLRTFNVQGQLINHEEAQERAQSIANFIDEQTNTLGSLMDQTIVVWGPEQRIRPVEEGEEEARATALNADVLIYGELHQQANDQWELRPKFFLEDKSIAQAAELVGEHALGKAITYSTKMSGVGTVNSTLRVRVETLVQLLYGFSLMTDYNLQGYQAATKVFQESAAHSEWARAKDSNSDGQEILYLFLGNAYLAQAQQLAFESAERLELLLKSKEAFQTAIEIEPTYARSYNGLGAVNIQIAGATGLQDTCSWNFDVLAEAKEAYQHALEAPAVEKPPSGYVDLRAKSGLGRYHFWSGVCPEINESAADKVDPLEKMAAEWKIAQSYYDVVLKEFYTIADPFPFLTDIASFTHTDLGFMGLIYAQIQTVTGEQFSNDTTDVLFEKSIDHYQSALQLANASSTSEATKHTANIMPYYLDALCSAGQGQQATAALDEFVESHPELPDLRDTIFRRFEVLDTLKLVSWEECTNATAS